MGTSPVLRIHLLVPKDHPHAYGDKIQQRHRLYKWLGSSPRVWGQVYVWHSGYSEYRIIPTRMGTRHRRHILTLITQDHPHAYGDKLVVSGKLDNLIGSSPRVWGQGFSKKH